MAIFDKHMNGKLQPVKTGKGHGMDSYFLRLIMTVCFRRDPGVEHPGDRGDGVQRSPAVLPTLSVVKHFHSS